MSNLRGFTLWAHCSGQDVQDAVQAGATIFRYQMLPEFWAAEIIPLADWPIWANAYAGYIEAIVLPNLGNAALIIELHQAPGGTSSKGNRLFRNPAAYQAFLGFWRIVAERFASETRIIGYGPLNEPRGPHAGIAKLHTDVHSLISSISPTKIVCITAKQSLAKSVHHVPHLNPGNTWYEVHMYHPHRFTHQGLINRAGRHYPTRSFTKNSLRKHLAPLAKLRSAGLQGFIGEFSASTYTDPISRAAYLTDCVDIFDEMNWPWCYHSWREAPVWTPPQAILDALIR